MLARVVSRAAPTGARAMGTSAEVISYSRNGNPAAVLSAESQALPEVGSGSVLVRMLAASITPTDFARVAGFDGASSSGVAGSDGVGVVEKIGAGVSGLAAGDLVVPARAGVGTWATHTVAPEKSLFKVGGSPDSAPIEALASLSAPAAAIQLIDSISGLSEGDYIIQNNAGSTVGQAIMQYASSKGIKTINILRHRDDWEDFVNHLKDHGGDIVVSEEFARGADFAKLLADLPAPKAGFSSVGGSATTSVARALADGATLVSYGKMGRDPVYIPLDILVSKDITVRGFNLDRHLASADGPALLKKAADLTTSGKIEVLLCTESFSDPSAAMQRAQEAGGRKVVMKM